MRGFPTISPTISIVALSLAALVTLGACESLPDWLGEPEAPPLPGKRIAVMSLDNTLRVDTGIADLAVRLPRPLLNREWPQDGGYANHAMHHLEATGALARLWDADIGEGAAADGGVLSSPVSGGGRVFSLDAVGTVSAFRADNGERLWQVNVVPEEEEDEAIGGGIAYAAERLFVSTGVGEVIALDAATSNEIWRVGVDAPVRVAPTVSDDRVFVITYENALFALDANDGSTLWNHSGISEDAQLLGGASPAVSGGLVIAAYSSGEIFALRVDNGSEAWNYTLGSNSRLGPLASLGDINGSPVIDDEQVYAVSHAGRLVALSLRSGERLWDQNISGVQTPWIAGNFLFILTSQGELLCLSRQDGRIRWIRRLPRYEDPEAKDDPIIWSGPLLVSDRLIVVSSTGKAVSISPYTGDYLGQVEMPGDIEMSPIASNGLVYILTLAGKLIALR
ncbi:MAG: PQQ-binding-like beta-propeller repeat protein [Alphaproteobacteria bacterium]